MSARRRSMLAWSLVVGLLWSSVRLAQIPPASAVAFGPTPAALPASAPADPLASPEPAAGARTASADLSAQASTCNPGSGAITGRLTAADSGLGLAGVSVAIYGVDGSYLAETSSNSSGNYLLSSLPPGSYRLLITPLGVERTRYLAQWYGTQTSLPQGMLSATPVQVSNGVTTSGVNAALQRGAAFTGRVTAQDGGAGLRDIWVHIYDSHVTELFGSRPEVVLSDATGVYTTSALPAGSYRLRFTPSANTAERAYLSGYKGGAAELALATPIALGASGLVTADIQLERGAAITGTIVAADSGLPLANVDVELLSADEFSYLFPYSSDTSTDRQGRYSVQGLPPGAYRLLFKPQHGAASQADAYLSEYYGDTAFAVSATSLTIQAGAVISEVNASLARGGSISGKVTSMVNGAPLGDVSVSLSDRQGYSLAGLGATSDASGAYRINGVPAGHYHVSFMAANQGASANYLPADYWNTSGWDERDPIAVSPPATTAGIDTALKPGGQISGRVLTVDGCPPALGSVEARLGPNYDAPGFRAQAGVDVDGSYTLHTLPPGSYKLYFQPRSYLLPSPYRGEYYNNQQTLASATPLTISEGTARAGVNAVLDRGGQIRGKVTGANNAPLAGARVTVYANDEYGGWTVDDLTTGADGSYSTSGLPNGSYQLLFSAEQYQNEYYNNASSEDSSTPVVVSSAAGQSNINASLALGSQISGRVTDAASGLGLAGIHMRVINSNGVPVANGMTIDASGTYTTSPALPSGVYRVVFAPRGWFGQSDYLSTYYGGESAETATPLTLTATGSLTGIDAALARAGTISGKLTAQDSGLPLPGIEVSVYDSSQSTGNTVYTNAAGVYTATGLISGSYVIQALAPLFGPSARYLSEYYGEDASGLSESVLLQHTQVISGIDLSLDSGTIFSGKVSSAATGQPLANVPVRVYGEYDTVLSFGLSDGSGIYTTTQALPAGSYRLEFREPPGTTYADGELTGIIVSGPGALSGLDIALLQGPRLYLPLLRR